MMHEDDSFDELIRGKLENRSFDVNSGSWQKAEKLIKTSRAGKFAKFGMSTGVITGISTIVVGVTVALFVNYGNLRTETNPRTEKTNSRTETNSGINQAQAEKNSLVKNQDNQKATDPSLTNSTNFSQENQENNPGILPGKENTGKNNSNSSGQNNTAKNSSQQNNPDQHQSAQTQNNSTQQKSNSHSSTGKNNTTAETSSQHHAAKNNNVTKNNSQVPKNNSQIPANNSQTAENHSPASIDEQNSGATKTGNNPASNIPENSNNSNPAHVASQNTGANGNASQENNPINNQQKTTNDKQQTANQEQETRNEKQETFLSSTTNQIAKTNQQQKAINDSAASTATGNYIPPVKPGPGVNFPFIEAGLTFTPGTNSLSPVIGGGYSFRIGKVFSLQTGVRYTSVGKVADASLSFTSPTYGFGLQQSITEIKINRLHYFSFPVSASWHINGRHTLSGGAALNYLFTTSSQQRTYETSGNEISSDKTKNAFGYIRGMSRFDALLLGSYSYSFGPRWDAELLGYYGMTGFKSSNYIVNNFRHNTGLQFTLHYNF